MPSTLAYVSRGTKSDLQVRATPPISTLRVRGLVSHPSALPYYLLESSNLMHCCSSVEAVVTKAYRTLLWTYTSTTEDLTGVGLHRKGCKAQDWDPESYTY